LSQLAGRVALVTGAARGIGEAIARNLAAQGSEVVGADIDAAALGPGGVVLDVRSRTSFAAAIDETIRRHGRLDVLVNNAAITIRRPFFEIEEDEWDEVQAVNLRGVFLGSRLAGEIMRDQGSGRIINLSSLAGQAGSVVNGAHYAASKAGILALTKVVARELAPYGVTVNAVAPAAIDGPVMAAVPRADVEALARSIPIGRLGTPEDVATLVAFLASDAAGFITGATFDVNGGLSMR
jgi:3-oxoacyl-[acyl-carrier protein] reductase